MKFYLVCLAIIISGTHLFAQASWQVVPTVSHKKKWMFNDHVTSHQYSILSDNIYYSNFDITSNWYFGAQVRKSNWQIYLGYGREYFSSSIGFDPQIKEMAIRDVGQTEQTHTFDVNLGYTIFEQRLFGNPFQITPYLGYSLGFGESNLLSFEGLTSVTDETTGELLFSFYSYDQMGVHNSINETYQFAQAGVDLNYLLIDRVALILGVGYTHGFNTIGRGEVDLMIPGDFTVYKSETQTNGSSLNIRLGVGYVIGKVTASK